MKKRYFRLTMAIAISIASTLCIFLFLPATFEQREFASVQKASYNGFYVQQIGFSQLSQMGHADGKNCTGRCYSGRCYVDYIDGTKVRRAYGNWVWICSHYENVVSKTGAPVRLKWTKTTIDLQ